MDCNHIILHIGDHVLIVIHLINGFFHCIALLKILCLTVEHVVTLCIRTVLGLREIDCHTAEYELLDNNIVLMLDVDENTAFFICSIIKLSPRSILSIGILEVKKIGILLVLLKSNLVRSNYTGICEGILNPCLLKCNRACISPLVRIVDEVMRSLKVVVACEPEPAILTLKTDTEAIFLRECDQVVLSYLANHLLYFLKFMTLTFLNELSDVEILVGIVIGVETHCLTVDGESRVCNVNHTLQLDFGTCRD